MGRLMMMWALAEEALAEAVAALEEHALAEEALAQAVAAVEEDALAEEALVDRFQFLV